MSNEDQPDEDRPDIGLVAGGDGRPHSSDRPLWERYPGLFERKCVVCGQPMPAKAFCWEHEGQEPRR